MIRYYPKHGVVLMSYDEFKRRYFPAEYVEEQRAKRIEEQGGTGCVDGIFEEPVDG